MNSGGGKIPGIEIKNEREILLLSYILKRCQMLSIICQKAMGQDLGWDLSPFT